MYSPVKLMIHSKQIRNLLLLMFIGMYCFAQNKWQGCWYRNHYKIPCAMNKAIILFLLVMSSFPGFTQSKKLDSMKRKVQILEGPQRADLLNAISKEYWF